MMHNFFYYANTESHRNQKEAFYVDHFSDTLFSAADTCTLLLPCRRKRSSLTGIIRPGADGIYPELDEKAFRIMKPPYEISAGSSVFSWTAWRNGHNN